MQVRPFDCGDQFSHRSSGQSDGMLCSGTGWKREILLYQSCKGHSGATTVGKIHVLFISYCTTYSNVLKLSGPWSWRKARYAICSTNGLRQQPSNPGCCVRQVMSSGLGCKSSANFQKGSLSLQHRLSMAEVIGWHFPHMHLNSNRQIRKYKVSSQNRVK